METGGREPDGDGNRRPGTGRRRCIHPGLSHEARTLLWLRLQPLPVWAEARRGKYAGPPM